MKKIYTITIISTLVLLMATATVFAYMNEGYGMNSYGNNMMNSYYPNKLQPNQNMMQGYSYEDMDKLHDSMVASIQDPELRNAMDNMHDSCIGNRD